MKRSSIIFLQIVIVLIGVAALALLLWEPQVEGVNKNATNFEIYFQDPFLALVYAGSIPFFIALYQAYPGIGIRRTKSSLLAGSRESFADHQVLRLAIIGFVVLEELFILLSGNRDLDNPGAPIFLGVLIVFPSIVVATAAAMFERILQNAVDLKSENDLTV